MRGSLPIAVALAAGLSVTAARADSLQEHDYILNCAGCHRIDGSGSAHVPSLLRMRELAGVREARAYWIQVPGAAQAPLSDARLAALMNWLVARFVGAPPDPPYGPLEVAKLRSRPLRDPLLERPSPPQRKSIR